MANYQRPETLKGRTYESETPCLDFFVTVNHDPEDNTVREIRIETGKNGQCIRTWALTLGRVLSVALQYGTPIEELIEQVGGSCNQIGNNNVKQSCLDVVRETIEKHLEE